MKKKLLFMLINMNIGGTEKALLNLLEEIPSDEYEITVRLLEKDGGFLSHIPDHVKVETVEGYETIKPYIMNAPHVQLMTLLRTGRVIRAMQFFFIYVLSRLFSRNELLLHHYASLLPEQPREKYDMAVAYAGPMDFITYYVLRNVQAVKKVQWIHFDPTMVGFHHGFARRVYPQFNKIFVVSPGARHKLLDLLPEVASKTEVFLNFISRPVVLKSAVESKGFDDAYTGIRIVTVGRLSIEKGQDLAIRAMAELKKSGQAIRWYCIGEGNERALYEKMIEEYNIKEEFILMGATTNPYPFIQQADIYVQPSRHEGYCITLIEAKCLNKSIVTTDFDAAKELILHGQTGLIVRQSGEMLAKGIQSLLDHPVKRQWMKEQLVLENRHRKGKDHPVEQLLRVV